jgi:DNA-binding PadR family transcriptional regulator
MPEAAFHILVALADQDRHGYAIMQDVASRTGGQLKLSPGTLYGSIKRLLEAELIVEIDDLKGRSTENDRRRYYRITKLGRNTAQAEADRLTNLLQQARAASLVARRA